MTCSKDQQGGIERWDAAERTQPLYMEPHLINWATRASRKASFCQVYWWLKAQIICALNGATCTIHCNPLGHILCFGWSTQLIFGATVGGDVTGAALVVYYVVWSEPVTKTEKESWWPAKGQPVFMLPSAKQMAVWCVWSPNTELDLRQTAPVTSAAKLTLRRHSDN